MQALVDHNELYQQAISQQLGSMGINHNYHNYDDFGVQFPEFVNPRSPVPGADKHNLQLIKMINGYLSQLNSGHPGVINNKDNRHCIKGIGEMNGMNPQAIFWLLAGYLAFDSKIASHVGEKGIYMVAECFEPLFRITKLTPSLKTLPKIKIKA